MATNNVKTINLDNLKGFKTKCDETYQNKLSNNQLLAVNSTITQDKVIKYDNYENKINDKATATNVYSKSEVDSKDSTTLSSAKSYTDTQLKTITDNLTAKVVCNHQYEITGNTGDEHGLAVDDQQMLITKIEGQTKVVNGNLVNSDNVLKSTGRNLIDITKPKMSENVNLTENSIHSTSPETITGHGVLVYDKQGNFMSSFSINNSYSSPSKDIGSILIYFSIGDVIKAKAEYSLNLSAGTPFFVYADILNDNKTLSNVRAVYKSNTPYEPYKEDTISNIGSLGQFDYIDMISQKKITQTSQVVTLNGSENWALGGLGNDNSLFALWYYPNATKENNKVAVVSNSNVLKGSDTLNIDNVIYVGSGTLYIKTNSNFISGIENLKQWLAQNPIQLVYKLATPTIEDYAMPSGMAVYNGGLQSQIGQVPYKITKQYNLSQKAQILANIEVDREQQDQLNALNLKWETIADNMNKYFNGTDGLALDSNITNKMTDMNAVYALTFDISGGTSTDDFAKCRQYGTIYISNQIDNYYGRKVLIGNGTIISTTFGIHVLTVIYDEGKGNLMVTCKDTQKRDQAVYLQTIKKLALVK